MTYQEKMRERLQAIRIGYPAESYHTPEILVLIAWAYGCDSETATKLLKQMHFYKYIESESFGNWKIKV